MARSGLRIRLETDEVWEACGLFASWIARAHELPFHLRDELKVLSSGIQNLVTVEVVGEVYDIVLTPRLRAFVGNLRAHSRDRVS